MSEFNVSSEEIDCACRQMLPEKAVRGLELFNQGEFFEAHEELETAWREETGAVRELYRGILQIAVAYYHALHGNYIGAVKMFARSQTWLAPFPGRCCGVDLERFRNDYRQVEAMVRRLGPERLRSLDRSLLRPIHYSQNEEEGASR